ncbi:RNA-directed DNA polymerase, eukaryota, reverse transcriptase zinc-binding domain protein [Tanacetum coccineum]
MEKGGSSSKVHQNVTKSTLKNSNSTQERNANKFSVLIEESYEESNELRTLKDRIVVDQFLNKKLQPTCKKVSSWSKDMIQYFKDQWEIDRLKEQGNQRKEVEDVYENEEGIAQTMTTDNNGCRILVSWDRNMVDVNVLYSSKQTMLCLVENTSSKSRIFCSFVYATNSGKERKELWKDILRAKGISIGWPWMIIGDFNVTLKPEEHSNGGSRITNDMQDFIDCVNEAEMEDLCSNGVFFTWIKSPLNLQNSVLKKLDRVMINEELIIQHPEANAMFLPYLIFDHSPMVVSFPQSFERKKNSFRFTNYIVDKDDFIPTVKEG